MALAGGPSDGYWQAQAAAAQAERDRRLNDLCELEEREQIYATHLAERDAELRKVRIDSAEALEAQQQQAELKAELALQRTAAFWVARQASERQAAEARVSAAESVSAAATAATHRAERERSRTQAELEAIEAESEALTLRLEVMAETLSLVAGRLDSMEDAMEAAEEQAEINLQQTAAFWLSRLDEARGAGTAEAKAAAAEAAAVAKARLADRRVAASEAATREAVRRAEAAAEAAAAAAALRRETDVQRVAAFWIGRIDEERAAAAAAAAALRSAAEAQQALAELRLAQLADATLGQDEAEARSGARREAAARRSAAAEAAEAGHTALRRRLGAAAGGEAEGGGGGDGIGGGEAAQVVVREGVDEGEGEGGSVGEGEGAGVGEGAGFYRKTLDVLGAVTVRAHVQVSDAALLVASDRISRMLRLLPPPLLQRMRRRSASVHIIGRRQQVSDLPEYRHLKGERGHYAGDAERAAPRDKRRPRPRRPRQYYGLSEAQLTADERTRGYGGLRASCGEENLLAPDADPRYSGRDVLVHEFAHCLMDYGLPPKLREAIEARWAASVGEQGLWQRPDGTPAYAALNAQEYFAELSMWYFGTHGEFVDAEVGAPRPGPFGLQRYDPAGFELVGSIYAATHPLLQDVPPPAERLPPAASDARSRPEPEGGEGSDGAPILTEAQRRALAADPAMEGYHPEVECDGSGQSPIVGTRFHRTGENFDLCLAEFAKLPEAEKVQFEAIEPPAYRPKTGHAQGSEGGGGEHGEAAEEGEKGEEGEESEESEGEVAKALAAGVAVAEEGGKTEDAAATTVHAANDTAASGASEGGPRPALVAGEASNATAFFGPRVLELDNSQGEQAVSLFWVDFDGEPRAWGTVGAGEVTLYHTWAGHAWEARPPPGAPGRRRRYLLPFGGAAELSASVGEECFELVADETM